MKWTDQEMYAALVRKDTSFEGCFIVGVKTTGICCRPSCRAKKPKKENVLFFPTVKEAILHGFRPCKICKPLEPLHNTPAYISAILKEITEKPYQKIKDQDLRARRIEPEKIRRWFNKHHGITFHNYQRMMRLNEAYKKISEGEKVSASAFDAGYESLSGFFDAYKSVLDHIPSRSKNARIIHITRFTTPIGPMFACATQEGICLLEFTDRRMLEFELKEISRLLEGKIIYGQNPHFELLYKELNAYFEGTLQTFTVPLVTPGTTFQVQVWKQLLEIPYGTTRSYEAQSIALENPSAIRAVARANGSNRISIVIPCHRVIGKNGSLTGYGGGLARKKWLLEWEAKNAGHPQQTELF